MNSKKFDMVLYGATSFVGQITARYLLQEIGLSGDITWAIAGRSESKLTELKTSLGPTAKDLPVILADSADDKSLDQLCLQTRVIISTVGPYALYGEPLIRACVANGNDYCDLTGEAYWIRQMIDKYQDQAKKSGARIVNCCGFDSIPSDLGTYFLQQTAQKRFASYFNQVKLGVKAMKGGASGGTIASMIEMLIAAKANAKVRKAMANPYLLCPPGHTHKLRQKRLKGAAFDKDFQCWSAPFVMEGINTRVVLRSHGLQSMPYGDDFSYGEVMLTGKGGKGRIRGLSLSLGLGAFVMGAFITPLRKLMQKFLLPKPGEGPSEQEQLNGFFDIRILGKNDQHSLLVKVTGDRDPGYGSTAKMLGQSALCLAFDIDKSDLSGGFWTPATAMGDQLIQRLSNSAGLTFEVVD
jgi:short subunit dehydrogenase-like uncharacterized protein